MRHRTKTQKYGGWLELTKSSNPRTGRMHYTVKADLVSYTGGPTKVNIDYDGYVNLLEQIKNHFDPQRSRGQGMDLAGSFVVE